MVLTFAKLQRLSGLTKPTAIKAWLKREGVSFLRDAKGRPFTTLDALNRKLHRAADDGFRLDDPEGRVPEKRALVSRRAESVDRPNAGGRRIARAPQSLEGATLWNDAKGRVRVAFGIPPASGNQSGHEAGI